LRFREVASFTALGPDELRSGGETAWSMQLPPKAVDEGAVPDSQKNPQSVKFEAIDGSGQYPTLFGVVATLGRSMPHTGDRKSPSALSSQKRRESVSECMDDPRVKPAYRS
jgi:hypothetical protein